MPVITQCYTYNTLKPEDLYVDNQLEEEEEAEGLVQHTNGVSLPPAEISQAALNLFTGNLYVHELQQNIANDVNRCCISSNQGENRKVQETYL